MSPSTEGHTLEPPETLLDEPGAKAGQNKLNFKKNLAPHRHLILLYLPHKKKCQP